MAAAVSSYPANAYHQSSYPHSNISSFYTSQYHHHHHHRHHHHHHQHNQPTVHKRQTQRRISTPTRTVELIDSNVESLRPRREPRIHRQVIVLPTPEPIYRQVRHRLPTPERGIIERTVIQKSNGDVIVQQGRHRQKKRNKTQSKPPTQL